MQVFKAFMKTALKFMPQTMLYFVIFSAIAFVISHSAAGSKSSGFQAAELDIGIVDEDQSAASLALADYLGKMHHVSSLAYDRQLILDRLFYRDLDYILVITGGFEDRLLEGKSEGLFETIQIPGTYSGIFVDEQVNAYLKTAQMYLAGDHGIGEAAKRAGELLSDMSGHVEVLADKEDEESGAMTGIYYFYQFLPYVLVTMIMCSLTPILVIFWEKNLARRMSCSAASLTGRNLQLALGSVVSCLLLWALLVLTSRIFYGPGLFTEEGLYCVCNSFMLFPLGIAISLIIGSFAPTVNVINMLNNIICLGMSFLCGIFVPQQLLGEGVLSVARFLPFYWYIENNDMISGFSGEAFVKETFWRNIGIQALFAVMLFAVALAVAKLKSEKQKE